MINPAWNIYIILNYQTFLSTLCLIVLFICGKLCKLPDLFPVFSELRGQIPFSVAIGNVELMK